jgi:hypothetical protein
VALEEKRAWIMVVVSVAAYVVYAAIIVGRAGAGPLVEVPYVAALLWSIGAAITAAMVLHIAATIAGPREDARTDQRDREIGRFGEHIGQSFVTIGAVAAMVMSLVEVNHFWIANALYLAFVLSAVLGSVAKILAYRKGFHPW